MGKVARTLVVRATLRYYLRVEFTLEIVDVTEEAPPKRRKEHLSLEATYDPNHDGWVVKVINRNALTGIGGSLSAALHELANKVDALNLFGSDREFITHARSKQKWKTCNYCGARIWFAKTDNGRWLPIDFEPIDGKKTGRSRTLTVTSAFDVADTPVVRYVANPQGLVWIPHFDVCGAAKDAPEPVALCERWNTNRKGAQEARRRAVVGLQKLTHDLEEQEVA